MRGERIKKLKLITKILETNGFRNPFQIMCDSEFLKKNRFYRKWLKYYNKIIQSLSKIYYITM